MRRLFGMVTAALTLAALTSAALTYDGSYYLFNVVHEGNIFVPNRRELHGLLEQATILLSRVTDNLDLLKLVFSVSYVIMPLLALALAWWAARRGGKHLFVWAAIGICLATLSGQIGFISEGMILMQFAWVFWLCMLTRPRLGDLLVLLPLGALTFVTHPFGVAVFGMAALLAFVTGLRIPAERRTRWLWAAGYAIVTGVAFMRFISGLNAYESEQLNLSTLSWHFSSTFLGLGGIGLLLSLAAAWQIFRRQDRNAHYLLIGAGVAYVGWAILPAFWINALGYRFFSGPMMLPFALIALADSLDIGSSTNGAETWPARLRFAQSAGLIFALTLSIQCLHWYSLSTTLRAEMAKSTTACVQFEDMNWAQATILNQWNVMTYALVVQGRQPTRALLREIDCAQIDFSEGLYLATWDTRRWEGGWFDLSLLKQALTK